MDKLNRVKRFFTPNQVEWYLKFKGETAQMTDQQRNEHLRSWGGFDDENNRVVAIKTQ